MMSRTNAFLSAFIVSVLLNKIPVFNDNRIGPEETLCGVCAASVNGPTLFVKVRFRGFWTSIDQTFCTNTTQICTMTSSSTSILQHYCNQHGSHLVRIETSTENAFLEDHIRHLNGRHFWLDLTDEIAEGVWVWQSSNIPTNFTDWDDGEPLPAGPGDNEDCAAISINSWDHGKWIDLPCTWSFASPLCEKRYWNTDAFQQKYAFEDAQE